MRAVSPASYGSYGAVVYAYAPEQQPGASYARTPGSSTDARPAEAPPAQAYAPATAQAPTSPYAAYGPHVSWPPYVDHTRNFKVYCLHHKAVAHTLSSALPADSPDTVEAGDAGAAAPRGAYSMYAARPQAYVPVQPHITASSAPAPAPAVFPLGDT